MKKFIFFVAILLVLSAVAYSQEQHQATQHAQASLKVRSLSDADIKGYLEGRGMGLAKPAELNSYPGPMHVLELAEKLELTESQRSGAQRIFDAMRSEAIRLGTQIVHNEGELNRAFADGKVNRTTLTYLVTKVGSLQSELRAVHLVAHLEMKQLLTPKQINTYDDLRGNRPAKSH